MLPGVGTAAGNAQGTGRGMSLCAVTSLSEWDTVPLVPDVGKGGRGQSCL